MKLSETILCLHFDELSTTQLYEILKLRIEVFCIEQNCLYQDIDDKDQQSWHLMIHNQANQLIAYSRLMPKGISYEGYASIGRVVSLPKVRKTGIGKLLMEKSVEHSQRLFGNAPIKIGAQTYLLEFYEAFGFISTGNEYLEDGIPHTKMVLESKIKNS